MKKYGIRDIERKYLFFGERHFKPIKDIDGYFGTDDINIAYQCLEDLWGRYKGIEVFEKDNP